MLYVIKFIVVLVLLVFFVLEINWDGSLISCIVFMDFVGIELGVFFLVVIVNYVFDGKRIWMVWGSVLSFV